MTTDHILVIIGSIIRLALHFRLVSLCEFNSASGGKLFPVANFFEASNVLRSVEHNTLAQLQSLAPLSGFSRGARPDAKGMLLSANSDQVGDLIAGEHKLQMIN